MKVYVLERGCYSDTTTIGVFSTRELAEQRRDELVGKDGGWYNAEDFYIYEWEVDEEVPPEAMGYKRFFVSMAVNGDVIDVRDVDEEGKPLMWLSEWRWQRYAAGHDEPCLGIHLAGTIWARSSEHAIKIASEVRAQSTALGKLEAFEKKVAEEDARIGRKLYQWMKVLG